MRVLLESPGPTRAFYRNLQDDFPQDEQEPSIEEKWHRGGGMCSTLNVFVMDSSSV